MCVTINEPIFIHLRVRSAAAARPDVGLYHMSGHLLTISLFNCKATHDVCNNNFHHYIYDNLIMRIFR